MKIYTLYGIKKDGVFMDRRIQLGQNIRALRNAYGETQEELGAELAVEKNTVSYYENGKREPNKDMISKIAKHYSVSVEELVNSDLTEVGEITVDLNAFWKNIEIFFPLVESDQAMSNENFKKAYEAHMQIYDGLHALSMDGMDSLGNCFAGYREAYKDKVSALEAAANFIAITFFLTMMWKRTPEVLNNRPAALLQAASRDNKVKEVINNVSPDFEQGAKELLDCFEDPEMMELLDEMKTKLKHSHKYSDIADYYLALQYIYGLVNNGLDYQYNQRIGVEMMSTFLSVGNPYAAQYFEVVHKAWTTSD